MEPSTVERIAATFSRDVPCLRIGSIEFAGRLAERLAVRVEQASRARSARDYPIPLDAERIAVLRRHADGALTVYGGGPIERFSAEEAPGFVRDVLRAYEECVVPWLLASGRKPSRRLYRREEAEEEPEPAALPRFEPAGAYGIPGNVLGRFSTPDGDPVLLCAVEWSGARFLHVQRWWTDLDLRHRPGRFPITLRARDVGRFVAALDRAGRRGRAAVSCGGTRARGDLLVVRRNEDRIVLDRRGARIEVGAEFADALVEAARSAATDVAQYFPKRPNSYHDVTTAGARTVRKIAAGGSEEAVVEEWSETSYAHVAGASFRCSSRSPTDSGETPPKRRSAGAGQISLPLLGGKLPAGKEPKERKRTPSQQLVVEFYAGLRKKLGRAAPTPVWSRDVPLAKKALDRLTDNARRTLGCGEREARRRAMDRVRELFVLAWDDRWFASLDGPHFGCFYAIYDRMNAELVLGRNRARQEFYAGFACHADSIEPKTIYDHFRRACGHEEAIREVRRVHGEEIAREFEGVSK